MNYDEFDRRFFAALKADWKSKRLNTTSIVDQDHVNFFDIASKVYVELIDARSAELDQYGGSASEKIELEAITQALVAYETIEEAETLEMLFSDVRKVHKERISGSTDKGKSAETMKSFFEGAELWDKATRAAKAVLRDLGLPETTHEYLDLDYKIKARPGRLATPEHFALLTELRDQMVEP